jgi:hypothetical protein
MLLCVWRPEEELRILGAELSEVFVMEVISEQPNSEGSEYNLMPLQILGFGNKLVLLHQNQSGMSSMFKLQPGKHILHIYNRSSSKQQCNAVIHARESVNAHTRYEK